MSLIGKPITIVYSIADEAAWNSSGNILKIEHHGLRAHTAAAYDAVERCHRLEVELERLRGVVGADDEKRIDEVLKL